MSLYSPAIGSRVPSLVRLLTAIRSPLWSLIIAPYPIPPLTLSNSCISINFIEINWWCFSHMKWWIIPFAFGKYLIRSFVRRGWQPDMNDIIGLQTYQTTLTFHHIKTRKLRYIVRGSKGQFKNAWECSNITTWSLPFHFLTPVSDISSKVQSQVLVSSSINFAVR